MFPNVSSVVKGLTSLSGLAPNGQAASNQPGGRTDIIFQAHHLYIEGVEVPYFSMSINSAYGHLPSASIAVAPQVGMMDIYRYYQPKVTITYNDIDSGEECILFTGHIAQGEFNYDSESGSVSITYHCKHRYALLDFLTLDFTGWGSEAAVSQTNSTEGTVKTNSYTSPQAILRSLTGVRKGTAKEKVTRDNVKAGTHRVDVLPTALEKSHPRLQGFPGVMYNMWNQMKEGTFSLDPSITQAMEKMYIPLLETGLKVFERTSGHPQIEKEIDTSRQKPCPDKSDGATPDKILVPPSARTLMASAAQTDLAWIVANDAMQWSGETTGFFDLCINFYQAFEYDVVVLSAPAEPAKTSVTATGQAIDLIVKPQIPSYFSPRCNVVLPSMYYGLNVSQDEASIPTRIEASHTDAPLEGSRLDTHYRGPASIREAIAMAGKRLATTTTKQQATDGTTTNTEAPTGDLRGTTAQSYSVVGKFEQGRGIRQMKIVMPKWLGYINQKYLDNSQNSTEEAPAAGSQEDNYITLLRNAWNYRYGKTKENLNPWASGAGSVKAHQRIMFSAVDYMYTKASVSAKQGSIQGIFNPYIVPGYPMDIIAPTPYTPSFHAFCTSVSHNISPQSLSTIVGFAGAITYTELANYHLLHLHPWLQSSLKLTSEAGTVAAKGSKPATTRYTSSIVSNIAAQAIADSFYEDVLGVPCLAPNDLYDFSTGQAKSILGSGKDGHGSNGGQMNLMKSGSGNLALIRRNIESLDNYAKRFNVKFIKMHPAIYTGAVVKYEDEILEDLNLLEPGQSQFLIYEPMFNGN